LRATPWVIISLGQCKGIKEVFSLELFPLLSLRINTAARDDNMHMRMQIEASVMRMQHRALAKFGFELACAKAFDRVRCSAE